ncbi:Diacylglycerol pyrophosphate phosphatase 1 Short-DGPP phosphatase [Mycena kentingensis (nom. inval.)]|nr:Diacylglycerol pyrophosphate phosphatase 1 Short-DGPP phosphatase [Mycena kentingensis (nom. inval.)]
MPPRNAFLTRTLRILQGYGVDWILAVLIALFANFYLDRFQNIPDFDLTDTSIQHSFVEKEIFPNKTLAFILLFCWLFLIISNLILSRNMWDLHHALLGLTVAFAFMGTFVEIVRISVGRPRPDFIARCNPFPGSKNGEFFGLANITICQTAADDPIIKDGMRSFFSGHACLSSTGLSFNSLYIAGKLQLFNQKGYTSKAWLVFSPLMVSIYICITRVTDHRHHFEDVMLGFFLGLIPAYVCYRQFYPSLEDPNSHLPYPLRFPPSGKRSWAPKTWFAATPESIDDGPTPLLPMSRSNRDMRASTSNLGHGLEADLEAGGLIATPFDPSLDPSRR